MPHGPAKRVLMADRGVENGYATNDPDNLGSGRNIGQPEPGFSGQNFTFSSQHRPLSRGLFDSSKTKGALFTTYTDCNQSLHSAKEGEHFARETVHLVASLLVLSWRRLQSVLTPFRGVRLPAAQCELLFANCASGKACTSVFLNGQSDP